MTFFGLWLQGRRHHFATISCLSELIQCNLRLETQCLDIEWPAWAHLGVMHRSVVPARAARRDFWKSAFVSRVAFWDRS